MDVIEKINEKKRIIESELLNPDNWRPNMTEINKKTCIPITTLHDYIKNGDRKKARIDMSIIRKRIFKQKGE